MFVTASTELKFHDWPENVTGESYSDGITTEIASLSWSKSNSYVIYLEVGGKPEILNVKDLNNIKPVQTITAIDHATAVAFRRDIKKVVAIGTSGSTVALYDISSKAIVKLFTLEAAVVCMDFNATDEYLGVACEDGSVTILNIVEGSKSYSRSIGSKPSVLKFHPVLPLFFSVGTNDGNLFINATNPSLIQNYHFGNITGMAYDIKQNRLMTVGEDHKLCVHDFETNTRAYTNHLQFPLTSLDISADGKLVAIGTDCGMVYVFETKSLLTPLLKWTPHATRVNLIKFSNKLVTEPTPKHYLSEESVNTVESSSPEKQRQEIEFKSLYNTFINQADYEAVVEILKDKILEDVKKNARQVYANMSRHMDNLQDLIAKEFAKMNEQMDEKWNFLLDAEKYKGDDGVDPISYGHDDEPIILE